MKITCVVVGKIKEKYFTDAIKEYSKRLSRYCKLEIVELADEKTPDGASEAEEVAIREKEGERILKALKDDAYVIALAIEGKMLDSVELSQKIDRLGVSGTSHIAFVIGGSLGLAPAVMKRAARLSAPAPAHEAPPAWVFWCPYRRRTSDAGR